MDAYDKNTMAATLKLRFNGSRPILTRSAVISEIKAVLPVQELTAIYKCSDGRDWYVTFSSESLVDEFGDRTVTGTSGEVHCERIDRRRVRFRIHWYPFHMKCEPVQDYMEELGSQVVMEYDTQTYEGGITLKTGSITGSMVCTEREYQEIPYKGRIAGRTVLITVMGRQSVCLRCGEKGHQRATCPLKNTSNKPVRTYAAAARGDQDDEREWSLVGSRKKPAQIVQRDTQHGPLSGESEVGARRHHGPLSESVVGEKTQHGPLAESEVGEKTQHGPLLESEVGVIMVPPQDRHGRGVVEEEIMEEDRPKNDRKRPREPEDTSAKKVKDDDDVDSLDLEEVKPILYIGLLPPGSDNVIEVDN